MSASNSFPIGQEHLTDDPDIELLHVSLQAPLLTSHGSRVGNGCKYVTVLGDGILEMSKVAKFSFVSGVVPDSIAVTVRVVRSSALVEDRGGIVVPCTVVDCSLVDAITTASTIDGRGIVVTFKGVDCSVAVVLVAVSIVGGGNGIIVTLTVVSCSLVVVIMVDSTVDGGGIAVSLKVVNVCLVL